MYRCVHVYFYKLNQLIAAYKSEYEGQTKLHVTGVECHPDAGLVNCSLKR